jgi:ABC-type nitrate/sulfonate/bicarbonate transport system substrate-binding protein
MPEAQRAKTNTDRSAIRLGFVPLNDCAPLAVAAELGLFAAQGLNVRLSRELGWATVRDKLQHGELDGAHAPCALPFALRMGVVRVDALTGLVLSLNGNAITLSEDLWKQGVRDAATLRQHLRSLRGRNPFTFGIVSQYSSHGFLLRKWLTEAGLQPDTDFRLVVVPPPQMPGNLEAGHLNGYCAGEPWNSEAVARGTGWIVATSARLAPFHPEKVLAIRPDFATRHEEEHLRLIAALIEACRVCEDPANRDAVVEILARPQYLNLPAATLRRGWPGDFDHGHKQVVPLPDFNIFHRQSANDPTPDKAAWVVNNILGAEARTQFPAAELSRVFRSDLFHAALPFVRSSISETSTVAVSHHEKDLVAH